MDLYFFSELHAKMVQRLIVVMSVLSIIQNQENKYQSENREGKANKKVLTLCLDRFLHKFSVWGPPNFDEIF
jgi:hypothetical protein